MANDFTSLTFYFSVITFGSSLKVSQFILPNSKSNANPNQVAGVRFVFLYLTSHENLRFVGLEWRMGTLPPIVAHIISF